MAKTDIRAQIVETFVEKMRSGVAPWVRPWTASSIPVNHATGRPYRGVNVLALWMASEDFGFTSNRWMTFKQATAVAVAEAKKRGVKVEAKKGRFGEIYVNAETGEMIKSVKKGEKGTQIVFWKFSEKNDGTREDGTPIIHKLAFARAYTVFNLNQCEIENPDAAVEVGPDTGHNEYAEKTIAATGADIRFGGDAAYYSPRHDHIRMPHRVTFDTTAAYYGTLFHELGHWTGAKSRLDRPYGKMFGDKDYALEELVAELTAAFLCAEHKIDGTIQHPEYLGHWIQKLGESPSALFAVASKAQKAADFVLGKTVESTNEQGETEDVNGHEQVAA